MNGARNVYIVAIKVVGQMLFLFGLLGWAYGVLVQITHPNWLYSPLSHLTLWLRLDTFTIAAFVASALGFTTWRLATELTDKERG